MNDFTTLAMVCLGLALGCSSTPTPNTSAGDAGSGGGGGSAGAGISATGGNNTGIAGTATQPSGGSGNAGSAAVGGDGSAGTASGGAGTTGGASNGGTTNGGGSNGGSAGSTGTPNYPPIEECAMPSVDRLTQWTRGEGVFAPASGSLLMKEGADYVAKIQFVGSDWHVLPVLIANKFDVSVDLSKSAGFTLTYSATSDMHVQLRTKSHWSGGDQYALDIPSTGGAVQTKTFTFAEANWKSIFGPPALSFADTLKEGMGFVFVGNSENTVAFSGLRIDGYVPPCQ
jgi:hypothetical protein